jgi:tetratricopeptide (TPR) repeat protein
VRLELIRFLLTHDQSARALAELLAVASDLPDEVAAHLQVGRLFAEAGDDNRSLDQFQRALRLDPDNGTALAGAGESAFHLGQYVVALTYLRNAPRDFDKVAAMREVVELVLSDDPLANRIGSAERRRRLLSGLEYARQRLAACTAQRTDAQATNEQVALQAETEEFIDRLEPASVLDQDVIEAGVDLLDRIARHVAPGCGSPTPRDRALILIGRQHGGDAK